MPIDQLRDSMTAMPARLQSAVGIPRPVSIPRIGLHRLDLNLIDRTLRVERRLEESSTALLAGRRDRAYVTALPLTSMTVRCDLGR